MRTCKNIRPLPKDEPIIVNDDNEPFSVDIGCLYAFRGNNDNFESKVIAFDGVNVTFANGRIRSLENGVFMLWE